MLEDHSLDDESEDDHQPKLTLLNTSSEVKHRRSMEKQQRKFQKLSDKQNVQEYQENFTSKNYTAINSKVEKLRFKKWESNEEPKVNIKDKVLINRRVLNDYIHIVNKRQDVVDSMEENFWTMVQLYDGTLHYFNKYYGKNLEDQIEKLNKIIKPEHRYLLKTIDKNEARIKHRIQEFMSVRNQTDPRLRKAFEESQNIEQVVQKNQELVRQRIIDRRNQNMQEGHIEKLQKKKGYIINEKSVESIRQSQLVMSEVQKFGSDRIKRQLFESDMKTIIENKEIQDKIHKIQQQMDRIQQNQAGGAPTTTTAEVPSTNQSHHQFLKNHHNTSEQEHHQPHLIKSPRPTANTANKSHHSTQKSLRHVAVNIHDAQATTRLAKRRHSHNSLNPFLLQNNMVKDSESFQQDNNNTHNNNNNNSSLAIDSKESLQLFPSNNDLNLTNVPTSAVTAFNSATTTPRQPQQQVHKPHLLLSPQSAEQSQIPSKQHLKSKSVVSFILPVAPTLTETQPTQANLSFHHQLASPPRSVFTNTDRLQSFLSNTSQPEVSGTGILTAATPSTSSQLRSSKMFQIKTTNHLSMRKASLEQIVNNHTNTMNTTTITATTTTTNKAQNLLSGSKSLHMLPAPAVPLKPSLKSSQLISPVQSRQNSQSVLLLDDPSSTQFSSSLPQSQQSKAMNRMSQRLSAIVSKTSLLEPSRNKLTSSLSIQDGFFQQPDLNSPQPEDITTNTTIVSPNQVKDSTLIMSSGTIPAPTTAAAASGGVTMIRRTKKTQVTSSLPPRKEPVVEEKKEKPLIRDKIYNENDIFKYKKINQYVIQEYYEKKILNQKKNEMPLLTASELQQIEEEKLSKSTFAHSVSLRHGTSMSKDLFWNNVDEKKADFLSLEKERSNFINTEPEAKVCEEITRKHGSVIFDLYKDIQKDCNAQIEDSKRFTKDIREGEKELVSEHKKLKSEYNQNLGPKVYKSIYVEQILNQTKKQLNIKQKKKPGQTGSSKRSVSPEKLLQNLLKQDKKSGWGKNLSKSTEPKEGEKKYSMIAQGLQSREWQKKHDKQESEKELAKYLEKFNNSDHPKTLKESLEQLMNLDSKRKVLFEMTHKKYLGNPALKNKEKNKYLSGILSKMGEGNTTEHQPPTLLSIQKPIEEMPIEFE